jgi:C1A family cysteine protease
MVRPTSRGIVLAILSWCVLLLLCLAATAGAGPATASGAQHASLAPPNPDWVAWKAAHSLTMLQRTHDGRLLGERPAPHPLFKGIPAHPTDTYATSYDLRTLGKVSSVKNQDPYGSCWSFATMGSMESCLLTGESWDFSEDNLLLTSGFDQGTTAAEKYDAGGNMWMSTAYLTRWSGPLLESQDPYKDGVSAGAVAPSKHVQDVTWYAQRTSSTDNGRIKYAVSTYGGAYVSMSWQGASDTTTSYYKATTHAYYYNGSEDSNHAVLVVGWNDGYAASNFSTAPPGNGAFIVKNSWGPSWGDAGYFYVSYYDTKFGRTTYAATFNGARATTNYNGIYQYDPLGDVTDIGDGSTTTHWGANKFTARANATLSAVGFYAEVPSTAYAVYTGTALTSLTKVASGTMAQMGFHTVSISPTRALTTGAVFYVAVKLTTPGNYYPVAVEYPDADSSTSTAKASAGQSYESDDGATWYDLTSWLPNGNVCLKAYTTAVLASTRYQEGDSRLVYSPAWTTVTNASCSSGYMRTRAAAGSVTATFTGTGIGVVATKGPVYGQLKMTLDAQTPVLVNLYNAGYLYQQKVKTWAGLTNGAHTLKLEWASGTVNLDALDVTGTLTQAPLPTVRAEETSPYLAWSSGWASASGSAYSGTTMRSRNSAGLVIGSFRGTGISLVATKGPSYGKIKVTVDGVASTVDLYAAAAAYKVRVYSKTGLANAVHSLRVEWTGTKNALATSTTVNVDALDVQGALCAQRTEETSSLLYYGVAWTPVVNASCSGSSMRTIAKAGAVTAKFTGTGISLIATKGPSWGKLKVTVDALAPVSVNLYATAVAYRQAIPIKTGLAYSTHTVKVEWVSGAANLDAIDAIGWMAQASAPVTIDARLLGTWIWYFSVILPQPATYEADEYLFKADGTFEKLILCQYPALMGQFHTVGKWSAGGGSLKLSSQLESWTPDYATPVAYVNKAIADVAMPYAVVDASTVTITEDGDQRDYEKQ